jgi:hypothetical protein
LQAALEAVNGFNLYGSKNASYSVIYADIDAHNRLVIGSCGHASWLDDFKAKKYVSFYALIY